MKRNLLPYHTCIFFVVYIINYLRSLKNIIALIRFPLRVTIEILES
ncbi:hypothetical protein XCR1_2700012 [Xenorhabdus cabanillasii JM26]|uniref:Uncharacterized protein n=1 Tax=Xenorhabdus cabanillasii JM26 TaxID=1427517 RepID=W1J7S0_9GAMM|nr:hypothetical protein XCR1_2700012 [Xenorhabdus cabanillasii JM26]